MARHYFDDGYVREALGVEHDVIQIGAQADNSLGREAALDITRQKSRSKREELPFSPFAKPSYHPVHAPSPLPSRGN